MKRTTSASASGFASLLAPPAAAYTRGGATPPAVAPPPPPPPRRSISTGAMPASVMSPRAFEKAQSSLDDVSSNNSTTSTASCSSTGSSSYRSSSARTGMTSTRSTDSRMKDSSSVRVAVRIRPLLPKEIATNERVCVERSANTITVAATDQRFTFDHVFPVNASQTELYNDALEPLMDSFLQGFNVTVIAYGQTGSGKTFTMGNSIAASSMIASRLFSHASNKSSASAAAPPADSLHDGEGLIPRFLFQLFERLKEIEAGSSSSGSENVVSVSFLEIYGEDIHDLLQPQARQPHDDSAQNLQLRESQAGVWVQGLTEVRVSSRRDALEQMRIGSMRRATGSTEMNEHSSRSHAVYTVKIVRRMSRRESLSATAAAALAAQCRRAGADASSPENNETADTTVVSKLTFVDLAGSERLKRTHAEGNRMKEGIQINVGLLALGNVINALGDKKNRSNAPAHVPYRSSKLTRLLQDALGGNSRTLFIACVSPAEANASESLSTLLYANRAKNIQNKAVKNIDSRSAEVLELKAFNALLQRELVKARFIPSTAASDTAMLEDPLLIEAMVDKLLQDAAVQSYLKRLEATANTVGTDGFVGSRDIAMHDVDLSHLAARFTAQVALATVVSAPPPSDLPILAPAPYSGTSQPERMDEIRMADDPSVKDVLGESNGLDARAAECEAQLLLSQQTCDERDQTIAHLEATQTQLLAQLAVRDNEIERLRCRVDELEANLAISKGKEEAFLLIDRCQEVWNELGLNAEDQAGKFNDINELLLKKCSEELEGLESAREQLHLRIDAAYGSVERLERVLHAPERVNLALLPIVAGKTLLAQEKYLLLAQARLEDELRRRYQVRTWSLRRIRDLVRLLRLVSWRELRHVALDAIGVQLPELLETLGLLEADDSGDSPPASPLPIERLLAIAQDVNMSLSALERDASVLSGLEQEQTQRGEEADGELRSIRSVLQQMQFASDELLHVLSKAAAFCSVTQVIESPETPEDGEDETLQRMLLWILQEGESLGVGTDVLTLLTRARQSLEAISDGRSRAIAHLNATLDEALALGQEMLADASADDARALISGDADDRTSDDALQIASCSFADLETGAKRLDALGAPIEASLRALLLSIDDEFTAFGIETDAQRISFFLGSDDDENNATRKTLERYISGARTMRSDSDDSAAPEVAAPEVPAPPSDSILSDLDPARQTLGRVYSPSYSKMTLTRLADAIADVAVVQRTLASATKRLASLQQIMKLFNEISEFQKRIGEFEASASRKDRLFGSSLRLLEEEKFRKVAAKRYPSLLAALRKEVAKWLANDDGEFDLSVLGADLKNLLLEMMNTDTGLMHLDLGVVDSSRTLARRQSKSSLTPTPASSAASQTTMSNGGHASAPARSRSMTTLVRESSAKKRLAFEL